MTWCFYGATDNGSFESGSGQLEDQQFNMKLGLLFPSVFTFIYTQCYLQLYRLIAWGVKSFFSFTQFICILTDSNSLLPEKLNTAHNLGLVCICIAVLVLRESWNALATSGMDEPQGWAILKWSLGLYISNSSFAVVETLENKQNAMVYQRQ